MRKAQKQVHRKYVAVYSVRKHKKRTYTYTVSPLSFSTEALKGGKGLPPRPFLFMVEADSLGMPRMAVAFIPQGEQAYQEMLAWILPHTPNAPGRVQARPSLVQGSTADGCEWVEIERTEICTGPLHMGGGDPVVNEDDMYCGDPHPVFGLQCGPHDPRYDDPTMYNYLYNWPDSGGGGSSYPYNNGNDDSDDQDPPPMCDPDSPINPVGCVQPESESVRFLGKIDASDLDNYPKADCIYQKLDQTGTMKSVISKFAGEQTDFNLEITVGKVSGGWGTLNSSPNSNTFYMKIDQEGLLQRKSIQTAVTFMHEAVHAEMRRYLYGAKDHSTLPGFPGSFTDDWKNFVHKMKGKTPSERLSKAEHLAMAKKYTEVIADGVQEYDNYEMSRSYYEAIAWYGLTDTKAWDELSVSKRNTIGKNYEDAKNAINGRLFSCH